MRRFLPTRPVLDWTDRVYLAGRVIGFSVLGIAGALNGFHVLGPAGFGPGFGHQVLGAFTGALFGLLIAMMMDNSAWGAGHRQGSHVQDRVAARRAAAEALAGRQAATAGNAVPARAGRNRPAAMGGPGQRSTPAPTVAPSSSTGDAPAVSAKLDPWVDPALVDAAALVVTLAGPNGAALEDIGDRLLKVGFDPTREVLRKALWVLTHERHELSKLQDTRAPFIERWYAAGQLEVSPTLVAQVLETVGETGTAPVDFDGIRSGLLRRGYDPSQPALERAMRVLRAEGSVMLAFGGYVRTGL